MVTGTCDGSVIHRFGRWRGNGVIVYDRTVIGTIVLYTRASMIVYSGLDCGRRRRRDEMVLCSLARIQYGTAQCYTHPIHPVYGTVLYCTSTSMIHYSRGRIEAGHPVKVRIGGPMRGGA